MSHLEDELAFHLRAAKINFGRETPVIPGRKFRFDFVIPPDLLVEVDGGTWVQGRHNRGAGYERDCEKQALAVLAGYRVLRVTGAQVESGQALAWIEQALESTKEAA